MNQKQISMYRLSKMTGIPEVTINNIKHKRIKSVSFHTVYKISKALEIDLEDLIPDEWKKTE
ncbi:helix-turn-helix domain-containing protein [Enterococcus cecorum]|uniref:helix-turn-helix domain-containing protein n=1 Tax=Enterococcus cecorum TaxID=44008 RepID=UPI0024335F6F|nr:helix-turn-helix transcriptional regulator [Enterococcus cecorum]